MSDRLRANRREFLAGIAAGSLVTSFCGSRLAGLEGAEQEVLREARRKAAHRRRRILFNNDGDDIWVKSASKVESFLALRHAPLLGTHVDSIAYCTTQSFNHFTHDTRVAEVFDARSGRFADNNLRTFLDLGTDGLRMSSEFAHRHGLESLWTLRMNDIHDAWTPEFVPDWKRQDPTRVMSTREAAGNRSDRQRLWSLVDFEHPDVEPQLVKIVDEVVTRYDIDGVELDFLRAPIFFRTAFNDQPVTDAQRAVMTRLVRKLRTVIDRESEQRGRPLLLTVRVPATVELCQKVGIDIKIWLEEQLVDLLVLGGGYITFDNPVHALIELAHQHHVPAYPSLSQSGLLYRPPRGQSQRQPIEAWYGAAARMWTDGADGLQVFNLFPGPGTEDDREYVRRVLSRIGSVEQLRQGNIHYAMSDAGQWMPSHYWAKDAEDSSGALPLELVPNEYTRTYMVVPEDFRDADISVSAELRADFTGLSEQSEPVLLFGSANFGPQSQSEEVAGVRRYTCRVPLQAISQGRNRVMAKVTESGARLVGVELWIRRQS